MLGVPERTSSAISPVRNHPSPYWLPMERKGFASSATFSIGMGVIKALKKAYPQSNIVAVDYDPGASEVNQLNRIKLMLSTAKKRLAEEEAAKV